jgi:hypothetical protein
MAWDCHEWRTKSYGISPTGYKNEISTSTGFNPARYNYGFYNSNGFSIHNNLQRRSMYGFSESPPINGERSE